MEHTIQVVPGVDFPRDAVTQKFAWLGRSGSGKTFAAKRFVEQMLRIGAQVVVVDTVGVWSGLRTAFDVPILGGLYGDIPLEASSGELVAEVVVAHGTSFVLDTSQFNDSERCRFMTAFGRRLFELKKVSPSAMHLVLDEGQDVVPQNPTNNENLMLHEWVRIHKQGRAFGMGLSIVSQRPQEINKKALNQIECVVAFQLNGPHERKALEYWLADKLNAAATKLSDVLPTLEIGCPFVWSPQWLKVSKRCGRVLPIESADTSQTPEVGVAPRAREKLRPVDLEGLRASMRAHAAKQEPETAPKKGAAAATHCASCAASAVALSDLQVTMTQHTAADLAVAERLVTHTKAALQELEAWVKTQQSRRQTGEFVEIPEQPPVAVALPNPKRASVERRKERVAAQKPAADSPLPLGEMTVLVATHQRGDRGITVQELQLVTGYKVRSVQNFVQRLRPTGQEPLVDRTADHRIVVTAAGSALVPKNIKKNPTGKALIKKLIEELPTGEGRVLGLVMAAHPTPCPIDLIARECTEYKDRSLQNFIQRLVTRRAVQRGEGRSLIIHSAVLPR